MPARLVGHGGALVDDCASHVGADARGAEHDRIDDLHALVYDYARPEYGVGDTAAHGAAGLDQAVLWIFAVAEM